METISGVIRNGHVLPNKPIKNNDRKYCLITILDEDLNELRITSKAMIDDARQKRLSALLKKNKLQKLSTKQEMELDALLAEVHRLAAMRARATRLLEELQMT